LAKLRVHNLAISLDGYAAGPDQSLDNPLGVGGAWPDDFVLTHHLRPSITMDGGNTFQFVEDGIESALEQAFAAADGKDVRLARTTASSDA
jgi:hypothetical protein